MGSVIGAGIGAVGSIIGGQQSAKAAKQSAMIQAAAADRAGERALTGYKYLTEGAGAAPMKQYINAGTTALGHQGNTQSLMMDLLGITGYENSRNGAQTPATGGGAAPAAGGGAPAAGGSGNAFSHYMQPPVDRNPPPFPTWYQQQSGQFAPGQGDDLHPLPTPLGPQRMHQGQALVRRPGHRHQQRQAAADPVGAWRHNYRPPHIRDSVPL